MDAVVWLEDMGEERKPDGGDSASYQESPSDISVLGSVVSDKEYKKVTELSGEVGFNIYFINLKISWQRTIETKK